MAISTCRRMQLLVLGCEPIAFNCANDTGGFPDPLYKGHDRGNLTAENAFEVVVHYTAIRGNATLSGGGGVSCALGFAAPYGDFEDDVIGGNLTITGWQPAGWVSSDTIMHNAYFNGNTTGRPRRNEIANNTILGDLHCDGNSPVPALGTPWWPERIGRQCERPVQ